MSRILGIVTAFVLLAGTLQAQVYPVQATVQLSPPYSLYLSDYVSSGSERLALNIFLADIARPSLDVKFRLKIIGQGITIETKREYVPVPVSLQGGVPLRLISTDLSEYFNADNLNFTGISRREYEQRGKLPEGVYQFCFEVLEYNRGVKISNTGCATAWLILNDPPIVNLPRQNEKLKVTSPQNVLLQWTPRHTGSPNSAFTTQYEIKMVEVWPSTRNPNDAILTSPPIYEETTSATTIVYGPAETPLEPGRRYAFRIKAKSITGVDELDLFKNNGYSEVVSFVYGDACDLPTGMAAGSIGTTRFSLAWDGLFNHTAYKVRYREAGTVNWYENNVSINNADIYSLKPATAYEYQVAATCGFYDGQYSAIQRLNTNPLPEAAYACGAPLETFNIDPKDLTGSLKVGDVIQAGDFDVKLTQVSGSNGIFSGEGVIEVPYFNKAKVKTSFTSISVNKDMRMVNGYMNVTGAAVDIIPSGVLDAMNGLSEVLNAADSALSTIEENLPQQFDPDSFVADTAIHVAGGISSVYKDNDGTVVIVDSKGNEQRLPPGTAAAVKDDNGNGYLVDKKGNVHKTTADVAATAGNRKYNLSLTFAANPSMKYGFDRRKHDALAKDYEQLENNYAVAWKSVASGGVTDLVAAIVAGTGIDNSKIKFEQSGVPLQAQPFTGNRTSVSVRGGSAGTEEGLLALYAPADTGKVEVLGKLNVVSYNKLSKSVVIVPVNKTALPSGLTPKIVEDSLNAIYGQAVADWKVSVALPIEVALSSPFDDGDSGLLTNYTDDMKKVIKAFGKLQDETYYLFLVDNPKSSDGLGYMPRGKQAGFIFADRHGSDKAALIRTMAHELGHGAFNLHHTFKEPNFSLTKGSTDNLMDYPSGNKLYKYQWDKMRAADIVIGLFEEDEEAKYVFSDISVFKDLLNSDKKTLTFLSPGGNPVTIPATVSSIRLAEKITVSGKDYQDVSEYPLGTLLGFTYNNIQYTGAVSGYSEFTKYQATGDPNTIYYDTLSQGQPDKHVIIGYPCVESGSSGVDFYAYKVDFGKLENAWFVVPGKTYTAAGSFENANDVLSKLAGAEWTYAKVTYSPKDLVVKAPIKVSSASGYSELTNSEESKDFLKANISCGIAMRNEVFQILNLIANNPGAYTALKTCDRDSLITKEAYYAHAGGMQAWYLQYVRHVRNALIDKIEKRHEVFSTIETVNDADDMESLLGNICEAEYKAFSATQRTHILEVLAKGDLRDCWVAGEKNCAEAQVIYTISQGQAHYAEIMKKLKENNNDLAGKLLRGLDNSGKGGDNFDRLALALYDVYNGTLNTAEVINDDKIEQNQVLNYNENVSYTYVNFTNVATAVQYTVKFDWDGGKLKLTPVQRTTYYTGAMYSPDLDAEGDSFFADPFETVIVRLQSDLKYPGENFVVFDKNEQPIAVPAFVLYWFLEANANKQTMTKVRIGANVIALTLGGVEMASAKGIAFLLATLDVIAVSSNLILVEGGVAESLIARNAEWKPIIEGYNNVVMVYSIFRGGQAVSSLFRASLYKLVKLRPLMARLKNGLTGDMAAIANKMDNLAAEIESSAAKNGIDASGPIGPGGGSFNDGPYVDVPHQTISKDGTVASLVPTDKGFLNSTLKSFAESSGASIVAKVSNEFSPVSNLTAAEAEMVATQAPAIIAEIYPSPLLSRQLALKMMQAENDIVALQQIQIRSASFKAATSTSIKTADGTVVVVKPEGLSPVLLYAAPAALTKILEKIKEKNKCIVCENRSIVVCRKLESVWTKAGGATLPNNKIAIDKLCSTIILNEKSLLTIGDRLLRADITAPVLQIFLSDITANYSNQESLGKNLGRLSVRIIDAWLLMYNARKNITRANDERHRADIASLQKVADLVSKKTFSTAELTELISRNTRLGCNPCLATGVKHLNPMVDYLSDLEYFTTNFKLTPGYGEIIKALKSTADKPWYRVEPAAFELRVLKSKKSEFPVRAVVSFEQGISGCVPDVTMAGGLYIEFKSWKKTPDQELSQEDQPDGSVKSPFENFVEGKGSYGQFKCYLTNITTLRQLRYYFDGRKLYDGDNDAAGYGAERDWVKGKFKEMFEKNAPEIFAIIITKPAMSAQLGLVSGDPVADRKTFDDLVKSLDDKLYGFIKVE